MRIWDIHPGYLNRQSLLGEHRELHAIVSIIVNHKKGYAHHPETLRWAQCGWALSIRHQLLAAEMALRGYTDRSPVALASNAGIWPSTYVDAPGQQFNLLLGKYQDKDQGRIPLPFTTQQLWSQHKYSVLARDVNTYQRLGKSVSSMTDRQGFSEIAELLTEYLRQPPTQGGIRNALHHMWGYVSQQNPVAGQNIESWSLDELLTEIQQRVISGNSPYITASTALSELQVWL
jgi:hypothetical protein